MTAIIAAEVHEGVGDYKGPEHLSDLTKLIVANNDLWASCVAVTKLSILMQYLRIFSGRISRLLCLILMSLLLPAACWAIFGGTFLCQPVSKLWNPALPGHCMSAQTYWISAASIDIGLDFLVLLLPMPAITALRLPRKEKTALIVVFLLGFIVCLVSVARLATVLTTAKQGDYIVSGIWSIIWSTVEANVGIICASMLALKPLAARLCPHAMEETKLPRHSMRLPMVQTADCPSDKGTLVNRLSGSVPTTPTKGRGDSTFTRPNSARVNSYLAPPTWSLPPDGLHAAAEDLARPAAVAFRCDGSMSFSEMLRNDRSYDDV